MLHSSSERILCVGLICFDNISVCDKFPAEGKKNGVTGMNWQKGGNAANTSAVLSMLGNIVDFFGVLPKRKKATFQNNAVDFIKQEMKSYGVNMEKVVERPDATLSCSSVIIGQDNDSRTILHHPVGSELDYEDFAELDLSQYTWVHFEGRNDKEVAKMIDHVVEYNKENTGIHSPIAISVELEDPTKTRRLLSLLPYADLVVVSQDFATSYGRDSATSAVKAIKLHTKPGAQIVCAWGSCGAASGTSGVIGDVIITPAFAPDCVVDTLGAGDTFIGGLIHAQIHRASLLSAVNFACRVAGHKVGSYGYDCLRDFTRNESRTKQSRTFVLASC